MDREHKILHTVTMTNLRVQNGISLIITFLMGFGATYAFEKEYWTICFACTLMCVMAFLSHVMFCSLIFYELLASCHENDRKEHWS